ncbi:MAG: SLC13 family permease [Ideonella sp.]|nr:SLC13 family permease [Ideonella sp.]
MSVFFAVLLVATLVAQAVLPSYRLLIVLGGAALSCTAAGLTGLADLDRVFAGVPWNVLVILVALGLFTRRLADARLFGLASLALVRVARARPLALLVLAGLSTYAVSMVLNNLTALLVILPVLLSVFALAGVSQRYLVWALGLILVACNLGGAATPIGDFPAVLLLGKGAMGFADYLQQALPATLVAMALMLTVVLVSHPSKEVPTTHLSRRLTLATLARLYRGVTLDWTLLGPCLLALIAMMAAWLLLPAHWAIGPALVAWLGGLIALAVRPAEGEQTLKRSIDSEALMFLLALFVMVGVVRETGLFTRMAGWLLELPVSPHAQLVLFLVMAALLTGLFSAGPSMAALLEVAEVLAKQFPPDAIYIGLALSVCAGSSLFLTAATAGPLMQSLVERAGLRGVDGARLQFGFREYLKVGVLGFAVTLSVGIARTLLAVMSS